MSSSFGWGFNVRIQGVVSRSASRLHSPLSMQKILLAVACLVFSVVAEAYTTVIEGVFSCQSDGLVACAAGAGGSQFCSGNPISGNNSVVAWAYSTGSYPNTVGHLFIVPDPDTGKCGLSCTWPGGITGGQPLVCTSPSELKKSFGPRSCNTADQGDRGNPCNAATGNKYQIEMDYRGGSTSRNSGETNLSFARSYNSQLNQNLGLGFGWSTSFNKRLEINGALIQIRQATGRGEPFTCPSGAGACTGDSDTTLSLSLDATGYTQTLRDGANERYDLNGKLLSEISPTGQITNYFYRTDNGRLDHVTGPFGHTLTLGYDTSNHVATVTDPSGQVIHYSYDTNNNLTRVDYPDGTAKIYYYEDVNNSHGLTGIALVDANNVTTRFSTYSYFYNSANAYDPSNGKAILTQHATTTNGSPQEKFTLAYDVPALNQTTVTDPVNTQEVMTFAVNLGVKNLVTKTSSIDAKSLQQTFDTHNNLTCKKDEEGHVTTYTYTATNQKQSMTEGLTGDCTNPPASTTATNVTRLTSYQYLTPTLDLPTTITSPSVNPGASKITTIAYTDTAHPNLPTLITQSGYTPAGAAIARTLQLAYNSVGEVASLTDANGNVTQLFYNLCNTGNGCGQLSSVTNALGQVTTYDSYDANGRLQQMTDPSGLKTNYTYDPRGRVGSVTQTPGATQTPPSGSYQTLLASGPCTSGACGQPGEATHAHGHETTHDRDDDGDDDVAHGRHRQETNHHGIKTSHTNATNASPVGATTAAIPAVTLGSSALWQYSYIAWGDVAQVIDPDGVVLNYGYDTAHYLRTITDGAGNQIRYAYDLKGNRTQDYTYDPTGTLTRAAGYAYDLRNHLSSVTLANTTQLVFDALGNLIKETDANNHATGYQYDALNRLFNLTDAANQNTGYGYDINDYPRLVTAPNALSTQYTYDDLGNRLSEVSLDRGTTLYTYDAAGNLLTQTDALGQKTTYTYDALNRMVTKQSSAPFTKPNTYTYDTCYSGRLCMIDDGAMPVMYFGYDGLGRMNYASDIYPGLTTQYAYTPGGRLTSLTDPSGRSVDYAYDFQNPLSPKVGQVVQVSTTYNGTTTVLANNIAYYPFGPMAAFGFGNGKGYQAQFDSAYRPTLRTDGVYAESITNYDGADNILTRSAPGIQGFTYDALNRLYTVTDSNGFGNLAYLYDPNGNRQSETRNGTATSYIYNPAGSNWLSQAGSETRLANPDGSTASTTSLGALSYDGYGDLTAVAAAGSVYAYDPFGRRNWKNVGNAWTAFAYGPRGELLYETNQTSTKAYVYLNGMLLARIDNNSQIYYYHNDHLGTPQTMTDSTGTTVWKATYEPFGKATVTVTVSTITNNLRMLGMYADETGLYYNGHRYYDPKIGRYISSDPIGLAGGLNTYAYVRGNPLRYVDPDGTFLVNLGAAGIGAAIGGIAGGLTVALQGGSAGDIAAAALIGAAGGAVAGFTFGAAGTLVVGGISGALGNTAGQMFSNEPFSPGDVAYAGGAGVVGGAVGLLGAAIGYTAVEQAAMGGLTIAEMQGMYDFSKALKKNFPADGNNACPVPQH